ncbi:ABC transporter ATP-binding protein [Deinococcus cellulosilyticus]|uniref:ABC transporter ATP-binding protein n=1 Tax=Deinococcus cellulosilyticus (strain DSM 18568 / NBRC 106333 / KACC 11606 / 5516J-15) TaxID=1223518 RepID=A0A511N010_DEIC1|nr:ABC transporter ATP-binding protein [Deinococcus cellulosilyticus]GEM46149.1 ABC transporter ATP-binding protein [Deinococcus cellulosilyticus NBRC 106333 = KACC 11606]
MQYSLNNTNFSSLIKQILRRNPGFVVALLLWSVFWSGLMSTTPLILREIINAISSGPGIDLSKISWLFVAYVAAQELLNVAWRVWDYVKLKYTLTITRDLNNSVFSTIFGYSRQYFLQHSSGSLTRKVGALSDNIQSLFGLSENITPRVVGVVVTATILSFTNPYYGLFFVLWSGFFIWLSIYASKRSMPYSEAVAEASAQKDSNLVDALSNAVTVKLFGGEQLEAGRFGKVMDGFLKAERDLQMFFLKIRYLQGLSVALMIAALFATYHHNLKSGQATPGDVAFILAISLNMVWEVWLIGSQLSGASKVVGACVNALHAVTQDAIEEPRGNSLAEVSQGRITLSQVHFNYPESPDVLKNIHLDVLPCEHIGIVGESGSGKTTLIHLLSGLYNNYRGSIKIDGQEIREMDRQALLKHISIIPQDVSLFNRTVRENILYGKVSATEEELHAVLDMANARFVLDLPQGLDTVVGERGNLLSGGQKQRIAIARAIIKKSKIIILDEATSALDSHSESKIVDIVNHAFVDRTVLVVAHRLSTIQKMDRIIVMQQGQVVSVGTHTELRQSSALYDELVEKQKIL